MRRQAAEQSAVRYLFARYCVSTSSRTISDAGTATLDTQTGSIQTTAADDATLAVLARRDPRAFAPLYERYLDPVYGYCYNRLRTREAAEDATSQVFYKALAGLAGFRSGSFRAWLFTIAHNVVVDQVRRQPVILPLNPLDDPPDNALTPEELAIGVDERRVLQRALIDLSPDQQRVIELRMVGLTGAEIAGVLGKNVDAIKMLQYRAMLKLRERLNQDWDALLGDKSRRIDPAFEQTLLLLHNLNEIPGPTAAFADRLWEDLQGRQPATPARNRRNAPWLAIAAVLALVLITSAVIGVIRNDDDAPQERVALATQPASSTNTPAAASIPTAPAAETPGIAVVPPTRPNQPTSTLPGATATPPSVTATVDPNATVPTGPTPPVQAGGGPGYETLEQMVNASDLIVVARITDETVSINEGLSLRAVTIERTIRGDPIERAYVIDYSELVDNDQFVLFLNRMAIGPDDSFGAIDGIGMLPIADGVLLAREDGFGSPVRIQYAGQSVDTLAADIQAIPDIDPLAEAMLERYGWTPLGKQSLWPRRMPERDGFERSRVLPSIPYSFESALEASKRIGLDFGALAEQDVQILVYRVEREASEPWARAIRAGFVIHEQSIVGAWMVVDETERPYGLDERDAALDIPAFIPTPEPTPTVAIPSGETINPAQFYDLAGTATFTFCWPYCDQEPKTVGLRNALVAALDQELVIQPFDIQPTPTLTDELDPSDGSFVEIIFGHLTPGWPTFEFGYDRGSQLVLLPYNAGWVAAPPELIEIMAGIEPSPPPTKPV